MEAAPSAATVAWVATRRRSGAAAADTDALDMAASHAGPTFSAARVEAPSPEQVVPDPLRVCPVAPSIRVHHRTSVLAPAMYRCYCLPPSRYRAEGTGRDPRAVGQNKLVRVAVGCV